MFKISYKIVGANGREWIQVLRHIDKATHTSAIAHGRKLIKRMWPSARVRVRHVWVEGGSR